MTVELIDQFILPRVDSITAQELFKMDEWSHLYIGHLAHPPKLKKARYLFIIRHYDKRSKIWSVIDVDFYTCRGWAQRRFDANKEHILGMVCP